MALEKCSECGGQVSTKARFCPHCGVPRMPKMGLALAVAGALMLVAIGIAFFLSAQHPPIVR